MIPRLLTGLLLLLALLVVALLGNTWRQGSRQVTVPPLPRIAVDADSAAESLAEAVRARTLSGLPDRAASAEAFERLHVHLARRYPRVHSTLERERIGAHSLLYTWRGRDAAAAPIGLMAHQDVVPVAPGTDGLWQQPPFSGAIEGGFVWGRGSWDDKGNLIAQLEAVERLLADGFQPRRTVYLIFGDDEEAGGRFGAAQVAALLQSRGVRLDFVIDEGLLITDGVMPGLSRPVALIGVAEKGYLSVKLTTEGRPGHSSMPPAPGEGAIGRLAAALARLDATPVPGGLRGVAARMFEAVGPEMQGVNRVVLSNLWLLRPVLERILARTPATNAMLRSTTALTVVDGGSQENVLPGRAQAVVNFRLLPGDTADRTLAFVRATVADDRVQVQAMPGHAEPSRVSSTDSRAYRLVERTVRELFPEVLVAPGLMIGATDARHFEAIADQVLRFSPVRATPADLERFHGTDERLSLATLADLIRFYHRLVQQAAQ